MSTISVGDLVCAKSDLSRSRQFRRFSLDRDDVGMVVNLNTVASNSRGEFTVASVLFGENLMTGVSLDQLKKVEG